MIIRNVKVYTEDREFVDGEIVIRDGRIEKAGPAVTKPDGMDTEAVLDGEGCYAIPGLIDLHFHGCKGYDFCDGTKEAIGKIAEYEASVGVTAISPATMTLPVNELEEILSVAADYRREAQEE